MVRAVSVEARRRIRAPVQRIWHLLSRLESHPRYAAVWFAADVLERSPTSALVEFRGFFGGLPLTSVQRFALKPPTRMEFRQVRGELREWTGAYLLREVEGDTELLGQLAVDAGIPLFADTSVQQILTAHLDVTLSRIKAAAERDLVRLAPRRSRPAEAAALATSAIAPESEEEAAAAGAADQPQAAGAGPEAPAVKPGPGPAAGGRRGRRRRRRRGRAGRRGGGTPPSPAGN